MDYNCVTIPASKRTWISLIMILGKEEFESDAKNIIELCPDTLNWELKSESITLTRVLRVIPPLSHVLDVYYCLKEGNIWIFILQIFF